VAAASSRERLPDTEINFIEPQNIEQGILNVEVKK
jgi:hypothetical protein